LRQPSISADETGIIETAEITKGFMDEIGGHSEAYKWLIKHARG